MEAIKTLLRVAVSILLTYALLSLSSCSKPTNDDNTGNTVSMNKDIQWQKDKVAEDLREVQYDVKARIAQIDEQLENASDESKSRLIETRNNLMRHKNNIEVRLNDISNATEETWSDVQKGAKNTFRDVKKEFERLEERIAAQ